MKREDWLVGEDAGDLQLDDEGREDGFVGASEQTIIQSYL
jgi:hypothetical protein